MDAGRRRSLSNFMRTFNLSACAVKIRLGSSQFHILLVLDRRLQELNVCRNVVCSNVCAMASMNAWSDYSLLDEVSVSASAR